MWVNLPLITALYSCNLQRINASGVPDNECFHGQRQKFKVTLVTVARLQCCLTGKGANGCVNPQPCLPPPSFSNSFVGCASAVSSAKLTVFYPSSFILRGHCPQVTIPYSSCYKERPKAQHNFSGFPSIGHP